MNNELNADDKCSLHIENFQFNEVILKEVIEFKKFLKNWDDEKKGIIKVYTYLKWD
jgi:hypothetical protein